MFFIHCIIIIPVYVPNAKFFFLSSEYFLSGSMQEYMVTASYSL